MSASIVLSGPPGVGKTHVGRALAARLNLPALDLDRVIEARTGATPAAILRTRGEAELRVEEAVALESLGGDPAVLALGGGTLTTPRARQAARAQGRVLGLSADASTLSQRLATSGVNRPLLAGGPERLDALLGERRASYAAVDRTVDASAPLDVVVDRAAERASGLEVILAEVGASRSRILVGEGLAEAAAGAVVALAPTRPTLLIVDRGVPAERRAAYVERIAALVPTHVVEVEGGEAVKRWSFLGELLEGAVQAGCGRQSVVVGLGGGATCDLAALAASLLGRGAPVVLVPSTLLAQVNASIGGKAAVNLAAGRNLVGAFHPATDVLVDLQLLESLDPRVYRSGLAELLKIAVIADAALFDDVTTRTPARVGATDVARAIRHKAAIVARDPVERGERRLLNLGHTLGHALESASQHALPHGEAVAVGLAAVARFSHACGWLAAADRDRIIDGLVRVGLPVTQPASLLEACRPFLGVDKKADTSGVELVVIQELGKVSSKRVSSGALVDLVRCGGLELESSRRPSHVPWVGGKE